MFIVYDKEMNIIPFPAGVKPLDIFISSIGKERETGRVDGANRKINYGFVYGEREINLKLLMKAHDTKDYRLLRDSLYAMFQTGDELYISEEYERGKRYLVSVDGSYIPERYDNNQRFAEAEISCNIVGLPFAESIGTTQDIQRNGINANDELWGFGMGLIADDESLIYTHTGTSFRIFNAGNVPIHPYEQELKITIDNAEQQYSPVIKNYDRYEGSMVEEPNHYTTTEGTKVYFSFTGNRVYFFHFTDDRGGVWQYEIDGRIIGTLSTHINSVPESDLVATSLAKRLLAEGLENGRHTIVMTFMGADPNNVVSNPRGWIRHTDGNYKTFEYTTDFLELRNNSNGDVFRANDQLKNTDAIVLDGPNVKKNNLEFFRKTNHQFISLVPGWNEFTITGATSARIAFDFRFNYK